MQGVSDGDYETVAYASLHTDVMVEYRESSEQWGDRIVAVDGADEVILFDGDPDRAWTLFKKMPPNYGAYEVGGRLLSSDGVID